MTPAAAPLAAWLDALALEKSPRILLGCTGHLELSPDDERRAAQQLEQAVLPLLTTADPDSEILILTGLAPGADQLFAETCADWLSRQGRAHRRIGLLPVPGDVLWADWLARAGNLEATRIAEERERYQRGLAACDTQVQLWLGAPDWSQLEQRQRQYRRLGAALVEHCELLVAILKSDHAIQPGGSAEVVAWREKFSPIPKDLVSGPRRHRSGWTLGDRLIRIDPSLTGLSTEKSGGLEGARAALKSGNYLLCYDLVAQAAQSGAVSDELRYLELLALANAGSTDTALRRLRALPPELRTRDEDWLSLEGRLYKDLAQRGGPHARQQYRAASECYRSAYARTGGYFSAINAATTALLGGQPEQARPLAQSVLEHVTRFTPTGDTDHYYLRATEAEAALLLADSARARRALTEANRLLADNLNVRSRTLLQLRRICTALQLDPAVLQALQVPPVIYLSPPSGSRVVADSELPAAASFVYAGLTEPRDLELTERLLRRGMKLHVVLAAPREKMLKHWEARHGGDARLRLGRLLEQVHETSVALGFLPEEDHWCDRYVGAMALGLSRLSARRLGCAWHALGPELPMQAVTIPPGPPPASGTGFERRFAGVIFADFAGFSRLNDEDLPVFWSQFMLAISQRLTSHASEILLKHTWGDALHFVTTNARSAAEVACEIQECLEQLRPSLSGGLSRLELRLSAHFAPVFSGNDPVEGSGTYFGTQLSFTARIEPITPPGMIFVTEAFAAQIALEAPEMFVLEYAGEVKLAKAYGQSRLFSLRRMTA